MPDFLKIALKSDIPAGKMKEYKLQGRTVTVANWQGKYYAFDNACTHAYCSLSGGDLEGTKVTCYCHGSQFDITSGKVLAPPAQKAIKVYPVKIKGDEILVGL